jgi:hypothetical protein
MTGFESRQKTMGELMSELRARLSMAVQGSASKNNDLKIKSFLQEAHEYVFGELYPADRRMFSTIRLKPGEWRYDWHDDALDLNIDPGSVDSVTIVVNDSIRMEMRQGIRALDRAQPELRKYPTRYDTLNGQIEVWPIPDQEYDLLIEHRAQPSRFDRQSDRPSVPSRLVFLYALAQAKADYRHPDAQGAATTFQNMLMRAKGRQHENKRYFVRGTEPCREPQVVRTANGYSLKV